MIDLNKAHLFLKAPVNILYLSYTLSKYFEFCKNRLIIMFFNNFHFILL